MKVYSSLLCTFITQDYAKDNLTFALQYLTLNYTLSWKHMPLRLSIVQIKMCKNIQHKRKLPVVLQPPKYVLTAVPSNRVAIDIKTFTP